MMRLALANIGEGGFIPVRVLLLQVEVLILF
jgi:hypothetical protein